MRFAAFGYLWATTGFFAGTLVLRGPVRWLTGALRGNGASQRTEDLLVRGAILLLLAGTGWLAWRLARRVAGPPSRARWAIPAASTALAAAALAVGLNPRAGEPVPASSERFVFGPYPTGEQLAELKRRGFTGVISLLHPAVVPFEPRLLAQERAAAARAGIPLIHAPMLPWISENEGSVERIRALARSGRGRYYVHCYLGRDRVNVVRRLLEDMDVSVAAAEAQAGARRISDVPAFERGSIYHLADSVYVTPYPTDEEWIGYVLSGQVRHVLSLLDSTSAEDTVWVQKERKLARQYRIPLEMAPIPAWPYDPELALRAARRARALPRPLVVHDFRSASAPTEAFVAAYRTGLPPLPPSLFVEPMRGGSVRVTGTNVARGPRPTGPEFGGYLRQRGVRGIVYVGTGEPAGDRAVAESIGLRWRSVAEPGPELDRIVAAGGPWYLYGPALPTR
ncbi:MAG: hypothetical protein ICV87_04230 [Gemmatimonadetes bacterium]|nr:hypothetical protein [Gemmatimonadota bacterium]